MANDLKIRSEQIMRLLLRSGSATIEQILDEVGSSAPSIRRDLAQLELRGLIRRTHGGAELVEPLLYEPFRYDSSFQQREQRWAGEKRRIGLAAADLVQENETIGLTAGTTTTAMDAPSGIAGISRSLPTPSISVWNSATSPAFVP